MNGVNGFLESLKSSLFLIFFLFGVGDSIGGAYLNPWGERKD